MVSVNMFFIMIWDHNFNFGGSIFFSFNLFMCFWLHWVLVVVPELSLIVEGRGYSLLQ